jgi:tRNA uridine 5-carbamoylmethylation protein Kti12
MTKKLLMTIGMPFSGKSQLAKEYAAKGWSVIERDHLLKDVTSSTEYRQEVFRGLLALEKEDVTDDEFRNVCDVVATKMLSEKVLREILNSHNECIFYDGTNLQKKTRAPIIALREKEVDVSAIYLEVPLEEIWRRAENTIDSGKREGQYNEQAFLAIEEMYDKLEKPTVDEGFTNLEVREWKQEAEQKEFRGVK